MHQDSCHCGAVRPTLPSTPEATDCNCSLCRRIGGPWVYFEFGSVKIEGQQRYGQAYRQYKSRVARFAGRRRGDV